MEPGRQLTVMAVAGFDPSGGAGVLADIKTISALGCYGVAAVTSITVQNTVGVYGAVHQSAGDVGRQMDCLFDDFEVAAVKTGMLPTREVIEAVASGIAARGVERVVVDPVLRSTSGYDLIDEGAFRALVEVLFPLSAVVTPNRSEAERVTGIEIGDRDSMERAAKSMLRLGPRAVLIKGGDLAGDEAQDLLVDAAGSTVFTVGRVASTSTHGTGCTLASALCCFLAQGRPLRDSVAAAKRYVADAIRSAPGLGRGHGPLNHFPGELGRWGGGDDRPGPGRN